MKLAPVIAAIIRAMGAVLPATAVFAYCPMPAAASTRLEVKPSSNDSLTAPAGEPATSIVSNGAVGRERQLIGDLSARHARARGTREFSDKPTQEWRANVSSVLQMFTSATLTGEGSPPVV